MLTIKLDKNILHYDVYAHIISYLTLRERIRCSRVCKAWHSFLSSSLYMWRDITDCAIAHNLQRYKINGNDIRNVELIDQDDATFDVDFLIHLNCSNIRIIKNVHYNQSLEHLLLLTGTTLSSLDIITNHLNKVQDILYAIFSKCPNLKRLRYYINTNSFSSFDPCKRTEDITILTEANSTIKKTMQQVEYLELPFNSTRTAPETLKQCVSLFTGLKHLYLTRSSRADKYSILDWLDNTFPLLQTIWINKSPYIINGNYYNNIYLPTNNFGRPGYKYLSYSDVFLDGQSVERFLTKYRTTNLSAFHYTVELTRSTNTFEFIHHFIMKDLVSMSQSLRSLVLHDARNISVDDDFKEEDFGIKRLAIDIDDMMYYFPCLEQLVLVGVNINAKKTTSSATVPKIKPISNHNDSNDNKYIQQSLKSFSIKFCQGVTVDMLTKLINIRFQRHMDCICIAGMNNNDMFVQVLDAISKKVQALGRLGLCNSNLNDTIVKKIIDSWIGKRLNFLEINGRDQAISPREVISYARQKVKYTIVNINSDKI